MKPLFKLLFTLAALAGLSSCFPEERIWWSPKGDQALVSLGGSLHLVAPDGEAGPEILAGALPEDSKIQWVSWLPDGSGFVTGEERKILVWSEARKLIPEEEAASVERLLPAIPSWLDAAASIDKDTEYFSVIPSAMQVRNKHRFEAALMAALERDPSDIKARLLKFPKGKELVANLVERPNDLAVSELCLYKFTPGKPPQRTQLVSSYLTPLGYPKVSPRHDVVSYLQVDEYDDTINLKVMSLKGGSSLEIASGVSAACDWTPDGCTLVFTMPLGSKDEKLQNIVRVTALQPDGQLMKPSTEAQPDGSHKRVEGPDRLASPVPLITTVMLEHARVHVQPDGSVLFASPAVTFPVLESGQTTDNRLYLIAPDGKSMHAVPTAPGDLPADLGFFDVSPDGKFAAIVESETDVVAVVDLASGKTQIISPGHPFWKCRTMPAWRSATELTFAALDANNKPAWMLWTQASGMRSISGRWPANATEDWLSEKKPEEQPNEPKSGP